MSDGRRQPETLGAVALKESTGSQLPAGVQTNDPSDASSDCTERETYFKIMEEVQLVATAYILSLASSYGCY